MEVFINREEVEALVSQNDYTFYGETTIFSVLLSIGLLSNVPLLFIYLRSKHIRAVADK